MLCNSRPSKNSRVSQLARCCSMLLACPPSTGGGSTGERIGAAAPGCTSSSRGARGLFKARKGVRVHCALRCCVYGRFCKFLFGAEACMRQIIRFLDLQFCEASTLFFPVSSCRVWNPHQKCSIIFFLGKASLAEGLASVAVACCKVGGTAVCARRCSEYHSSTWTQHEHSEGRPTGGPGRTGTVVSKP